MRVTMMNILRVNLVLRQWQMQSTYPRVQMRARSPPNSSLVTFVGPKNFQAGPRFAIILAATFGGFERLEL